MRNFLRCLVLCGVIGCSTSTPSSPTVPPTTTADGGVDAADGGTNVVDGGSLDAGGTTPASCASSEPPGPRPEGNIRIFCADPDAVLDSTSNFDQIHTYFAGLIEGSAATWSMAIPSGAKWVEGAGGTFGSVEEQPTFVRFVGHDRDDAPITLELSRSVNPKTTLRCAQLALPGSTVPLSCHVEQQAEARRGRCDRFGFPGSSVLGGHGFIVSFIGTPPGAHVEEVVKALKATSLPVDVKEISGGPDAGSSLFAYSARFADAVSPDDARREITTRWCLLADDLRIDGDSELN